LGCGGRSNPRAGVRAAPRGPARGGGQRARHAGQPAGGVAASQGLEAGGAGGGPGRGDAPGLLHRPARRRCAPQMARSNLGRGAGVVPGRGRADAQGGARAMTSTITLSPGRKTIRVNASAAHAFEVFTSGLDRWWPRDHGIGKKPMKAAVMETHLGGRWYELAEDGSQATVGRIIVWEPPERFVMTWDINSQW